MNATLSPITDPRRMLNGYTFAIEFQPSCFVLGCYGEAVVGCVHQRFGRVVCCADHDAIKHGMAKPLVSPAPVARLMPLPSAPPAGGKKVRPIVPIQPRSPLAGAARPF